MTHSVALAMPYEYDTPEGRKLIFPEWGFVGPVLVGWDLDPLNTLRSAQLHGEDLINVPNEVCAIVRPPVKVQIRHLGFPVFVMPANIGFGTTTCFPSKFLLAPLLAGMRASAALKCVPACNTF